MKHGIFRGMSKAGVCLCLLAVMAWLFAACSKNERSPATGSNMSEIKITIAGKIFTAELADTPAAAEFSKRLPLTLRMNELNGNEKYAGLSDKLPADPTCPGRIGSGELMLYGNSTLVLFYESFPTSYSYTRIGKITDARGLKEAVGRENITVTFETMQDKQ